MSWASRDTVSRTTDPRFDLFEGEVKLAGPNAPEIEQLVHEAPQPPVLPLDDLERGSDAVLGERSAKQTLHGQVHRRQRASNFVRRDREEFVARGERVARAFVQTSVVDRQRDATGDIGQEGEVIRLVLLRGGRHEGDGAEHVRATHERRRDVGPVARGVEKRMSAEHGWVQLGFLSRARPGGDPALRRAIERHVDGAALAEEGHRQVGHRLQGVIEVERREDAAGVGEKRGAAQQAVTFGDVTKAPDASHDVRARPEGERLALEDPAVREAQDIEALAIGRRVEIADAGEEGLGIRELIARRMTGARGRRGARASAAARARATGSAS